MWQGFHTALVVVMHAALNASLPAEYAATIERDSEEKPRRLVIRRFPGREFETVLELLSLPSKSGRGRLDYLAKREILIDQPVHLVEIDLLVGGRRPPMGAPLPPGDFFAFVSRAERRPNSEVYAWSVRSAPPALPIPLFAPDPDVNLDLAELVVRVHDQGRYDRILDRRAPLELPLEEDVRLWAESLDSGTI